MALSLTVGISAAAGAKGKSATKHPRVSIVMFGDSTALTLGWSLNDGPIASKYGSIFADQGSVGCGVVMGPVVRVLGAAYPVQGRCNGQPAVAGAPLSSQPWPIQWQAEMDKVHPNVVVLLAGRWEDVDREYNGAWTNILDPTFAAYVKQLLEFGSTLVTATGANMVFMTGACTSEGLQPNGQPWPEDDPARLAAYNGLVRQVAAEYPATDSVVDLDAVVCPGGKYSATYKGVTIRDTDGVHFLKSSGLTLAAAIMPPIVAAGRAQQARVGVVASKHKVKAKSKTK
jgi:hypothetical protein